MPRTQGLLVGRCLVLPALLATLPTAQEQVWPALTLTAATYDDARARVVVVGTSAAGFETWEHDGRRWERVATGGPAPAEELILTYDVARRRVVLFDGRARSAGSTATSTWLWDGAAWTLADTTGPSPRMGGGITWDARRERVLLFGGTAEPGMVLLSDLWAWDGQRWDRLHASGAPNGPTPRGLFAMAHDPVRDRLVIAAGFVMVEGRPQVLNDTWEWDGSRWARASATELTPRDHVAMVFDPIRGRIVLHGGGTPATGPVGDTWTFDGTTWRRLTTEGPPAARHRLLFHRERGEVITYGGWTNSRERTNRMHALQGDRWEEIR